jgi:hypothetical protein
VRKKWQKKEKKKSRRRVETHGQLQKTGNDWVEKRDED